jgi:DNA (cytosine-5)-methyltransferase 1
VKFVSLFAGIGGIDLGLERAGHTCVGQVEIDEYATRVLQKHWPDTPRIRDVRDFHGHEFGPFDLLTGGYPCQPFSKAGNRRGEADPRHLWPEVHRIIRNVRPRFVLLENVPGHLSLGFGRVLGDLAESGYDAEWDCIPASAVGAPHQRDRVWIVAYPDGDGLEAPHARVWDGVRHDLRKRAAAQRRRHQLESRASAHRPTMADAASELGDGRANHARVSVGAKALPEPGDRCGPAQVADPDRIRRVHAQAQKHAADTRQHALGDASSGRWWRTEPDVGRVADGVPDRTHRLRALGNAVVPQVAELIGRRLPL